MVSDRWDYRRGEEIVRELERRYGLRQVEPSHLLEPERAITEGGRGETVIEVVLASGRRLASRMSQVTGVQSLHCLQVLTEGKPRKLRLGLSGCPS